MLFLWGLYWECTGHNLGLILNTKYVDVGTFGFLIFFNWIDLASLEKKINSIVRYRL